MSSFYFCNVVFLFYSFIARDDEGEVKEVNSHGKSRKIEPITTIQVCTGLPTKNETERRPKSLKTCSGPDNREKMDKIQSWADFQVHLCH